MQFCASVSNSLNARLRDKRDLNLGSSSYFVYEAVINVLFYGRLKR